MREFFFFLGRTNGEKHSVTWFLAEMTRARFYAEIASCSVLDEWDKSRITRWNPPFFNCLEIMLENPREIWLCRLVIFFKREPSQRRMLSIWIPLVFYKPNKLCRNWRKKKYRNVNLRSSVSYKRYKLYSRKIGF